MVPETGTTAPDTVRMIRFGIFFVGKINRTPRAWDVEGRGGQGIKLSSRFCFDLLNKWYVTYCGGEGLPYEVNKIIPILQMRKLSSNKYNSRNMFCLSQHFCQECGLPRFD